MAIAPAATASKSFFMLSPKQTAARDQISTERQPQNRRTAM
jgi:hypothetical protein